MDVRIAVQISKADAKKRLVFGWANVSVTKDGEEITDLHGDIIPPDVLEKAAYNYVIRHREAGLEHEVMGVADLAESAFIDPDKLKAMGIKDTAYEGQGWWIGFRVNDPDVWAAVEKGDLPMFSIGGVGHYVDVEE